MILVGVVLGLTTSCASPGCTLAAVIDECHCSTRPLTAQDSAFYKAPLRLAKSACFVGATHLSPTGVSVHTDHAARRRRVPANARISVKQQQRRRSAGGRGVGRGGCGAWSPASPYSLVRCPTTCLIVPTSDSQPWPTSQQRPAPAHGYISARPRGRRTSMLYERSSTASRRMWIGWLLLLVRRALGMQPSACDNFPTSSRAAKRRRGTPRRSWT